MSSTDRSTGGEKHNGKKDLHEYAGGYIQAHHGGIPIWLMVVYAILLVWGLYYAYVYWGSLGPGLAQ